MDTAFVDVMAWAGLAVERCVALREGEQALVLVDTRSEEYRGARAFAQAIMAAVRARGGVPTLLVCPARENQVEEPPGVVAAAMKAADVIFSLPTLPVTKTVAMREAL